MKADLVVDEQLEAGLGCFEMETGVFEHLHFFEEPALKGFVLLDVELVADLGGDVAGAGEFADEDFARGKPGDGPEI